MTPLYGQGAEASPTSLPSPPPPATSPSLVASPPSERAVRAAIPTPSLKPTEFITWIKFERPRFALGEIIVSSLTFVGLAFALAVGLGILLGHFRSKRRRGTHGTGGLGLR